MIKKILICPLNWGLGHATRCVPIIKSLTKLGQHVVVAADKAPLSFLQKAFPNLNMIKLPGFEPIYSKSDSQVLKLAISVPGALIDFRKEHLAIESIVKEYNIDAIISDNRFGCRSKNTYSVFITHQLHIQSPKSWKWTSSIINGINHSYIKKYDELWIPDVAEEPSLSGILSHPADEKIKTSYIGFLSRFQDNISNDEDKDIDYLIILSGPEPQRSIFENLVIKQAKNINGRIVMLRAKPDRSELPKDIPSNVTAFNHVEDKLFANLISKSKNIICRGGYSSLMDLIRLNKNAYLVPTPGQTEQEYLAEYLSKTGFFNTCKQKDFQLNKVSIPDVKINKYYNDNPDFLDEFLDNWINTI